jgi:hypothetical protein
LTPDNPRLTVTLTDRRPASILKDEWPIISSATKKDHETDEACKLFVRKNRKKKMALVYGIRTGGGRRGGVLLEDCTDEAIQAAVLEVGSDLDFNGELINDVLRDLPAEEI